MGTKLLTIPWDGGEPEELDVDETYPALNAACGGYIEAVDLYEYGDYDRECIAVLWMNEDYMQVGYDEDGKPMVNHLATAVCKALSPATRIGAGFILGGCAITGPSDANGDTTSVSDEMRQLIADTYEDTKAAIAELLAAMKAVG